VVYTTDGLNRKVGSRSWRDDKSLFPDYFGVFVVPGRHSGGAPELEDILEQLTGQISTDQMAELTYQVDVLGRTVDEVAREFLVSLGLLSA
jgi:glycine betaine/choline ABC-type transport system substrate-binding protein